MNQNEEKKEAPVAMPTPREKSGRVLPVPFTPGQTKFEKSDERGGAS